jgi:proteic killer suppression protein
VNITFRHQKFEKLVNDDRKLYKELGKIRADKLKQRLDDMRAAATLDDVRHLPGKYHELVGDRKGQWACDLDQPYRLIFQPHEDPIPMNDHGQYDWSNIQGIEVIEIVNYH